MKFFGCLAIMFGLFFVIDSKAGHKNAPAQQVQQVQQRYVQPVQQHNVNVNVNFVRSPAAYVNHQLNVDPKFRRGQLANTNSYTSPNISPANIRFEHNKYVHLHQPPITAAPIIEHHVKTLPPAYIHRQVQHVQQVQQIHQRYIQPVQQIQQIHAPQGIRNYQQSAAFIQQRRNICVPNAPVMPAPYTPVAPAPAPVQPVNPDVNYLREQPPQVQQPIYTPPQQIQQPVYVQQPCVPPAQIQQPIAEQQPCTPSFIKNHVQKEQLLPEVGAQPCPPQQNFLKQKGLHAMHCVKGNQSFIRHNGHKH